jgi:ABC-2 type transport system permease protein
VANISSLSADIRVFFGGVSVFLIYLIPLITMRLFSEEKKTKTDQLLLTAPVSIWDIVFGKFTAALALFGIGLAGTLVFPILLASWSTLEIWITVGNYFGIVLLAAAFISIGLFISMLTENQIIAAAITYAVFLVLGLMGNLASQAQNTWIQGAISWFSIMDRYAQFADGLLNPAIVIYYVSVTGLFLFFSARLQEQRRWN